MVGLFLFFFFGMWEWPSSVRGIASLRHSLFMQYEQLDSLQPCVVCGSRRFWLDPLNHWQCEVCLSGISSTAIRVERKRLDLKQ